MMESFFLRNKVMVVASVLAFIALVSWVHEHLVSPPGASATYSPEVTSALASNALKAGKEIDIPLNAKGMLDAKAIAALPLCSEAALMVSIPIRGRCQTAQGGFMQTRDYYEDAYGTE